MLVFIYRFSTIMIMINTRSLVYFSYITNASMAHSYLFGSAQWTITTASFYLGGEREASRVKCLAKEHNRLALAGLYPTTFWFIWCEHLSTGPRHSTPHVLVAIQGHYAIFDCASSLSLSSFSHPAYALPKSSGAIEITIVSKVVPNV